MDRASHSKLLHRAKGMLIPFRSSTGLVVALMGSALLCASVTGCTPYELRGHGARTASPAPEWTEADYERERLVQRALQESPADILREQPREEDLERLRDAYKTASARRKPGRGTLFLQWMVGLLGATFAVEAATRDDATVEGSAMGFIAGSFLLMTSEAVGSARTWSRQESQRLEIHAASLELLRRVHFGVSATHESTDSTRTD